MASIQSTSNVSGTNTVTPLYVLSGVSQNGTTKSSAVVTPGIITTLGATSASGSLTYDAISLLQTFSPAFPVSGLTAAQQKQLALSLGLNASATSADLSNAINSLLTPANPTGTLVNVLVGGTTTQTTNSIIPSFLDSNGGIAGVPATTASQVSDTVFATLIGLGTTTATTSTTNTPSTTNTQVTTGNPSSASTNPATGAAPTPTPAATSLTSPVPNNTQSLVANAAASNTSQTPGNLPSANLSVAITQYLATAALNNPATTASVINTVTTPVILPTSNAIQIPSATSIVANIATAETGITTATANTTAATAAAISTAPDAATLAITNATVNLLAENAIQSVGNLPVTGASTTPSQTNPTIAQTVTPTGTITAVNETATTAVTVVNNLPTTTSTPVATVPAVNTAPITVNNADSVLQTLLANAASGALNTANQATIAYSIPGAVYQQVASGIDTTRQASLKGKLPADIPDKLSPVVRAAAVRGALNRHI